MAYPALVLLSDFGDGNGSGAMTGVIKRVEPALPVYELSNDVLRFDIAEAACMMADQLLAWPSGTVFVCAVDPYPGVRVLACETSNGSLLVGPDNGCFAAAKQRYGLRAVRDISELSAEYLGLAPDAVSHGRNLAWCAAKLAAGQPAFSQAGVPVDVADLKA